MGYRSKVGIKCENKAFELFKEAYTLNDFFPDKILLDGDEHLIIWDWVKWYEDYKEVKAVYDVMNKLDALDEVSIDGVGYKMIRLGEDASDIEERDNCCDIEFYYIRDFDTEGMKEERDE